MTSALFRPRIHSLPLQYQGKVRDSYAVSTDKLLIVTSDRISAFDVILPTPIPQKGYVLNQMALFWFNHLSPICRNHLTGIDPVSVVSPREAEQVAGRSVVVKKLKPIMVEAVVRGYLTGSGWKDYQQNGQVCGITLAKGLRNAEQLPDPIFTPAYKAEMGAHDENISFAQMVKQVGQDLAEQIKAVSLSLYQEAARFAATRGIIIADTKFEFGLDENGQLVLMDEVLTPDSSRFWDVQTYQVGSNPHSFDKQYVRDWLEQVVLNNQPWNKAPPAPDLPSFVVEQTTARYLQALQQLIHP